jgi:hypothetical protein
MIRKYHVTIEIELDNETKKEGEEQARGVVEFMKLPVISSKCASETVSERQKRALHLWFSQVSEEANAKGLTLDLLFKNPQQMRITPGLLKEYFKEYIQFLYQKTSHTKLTREEFDKLVSIFGQIWAERLDINAPFPSMDSLFHDKEN